MERIRVLLAVDSTHYAQIISKCLADEAPELQLVFFTDEDGNALDSGDIVDLLTTIAESEPDVMVHATEELEPNTDLYGWVFGQYPFLPIVHINRDGRIRRFRQSISMEEFSNQAKESCALDGVGRLLAAIRDSIESGARCASSGSVSDEVLVSEAFTQFPNP